MRPRVSIALLSEDRSEATWRGLKAILQKLLRRFEDDGFTPRIEIVPVDPSVRPVVIANPWRSAQAKDEAAKRELCAQLAAVRRVLQDRRLQSCRPSSSTISPPPTTAGRAPSAGG